MQIVAKDKISTDKLHFQHKDLANGRWQKLSLIAQMANIGSEVSRAINWRNKDAQYSQMALERAIELFDLTISDPKNRQRLFEVSRAKEFLLDYFLGDKSFGFFDIFWQNYFYNFAVAYNLRSQAELARC